jgi:hypothetical protein
MASDCGDLSVGDELERVGGAGVLSERNVVEVDLAGVFVKSNILKHSSELDGVVDLWLLLSTESDALGIAATLDVEDSLVTPDVLVITDKFTVADCAECSLASSGKSEEEADVTVLADVAAGVEGKVSLLGHEVVHDGEDSLLHLTRVLRAQNDHLAQLEVQ